MFKFVYDILRKSYHWIKFQYSVNWSKTIYFNLKKFPLKVALRLPVYFYGRVKFRSLRGKIEIKAPIKRGMIGFGQSYEMKKSSKGISEFYLEGNLVFKGHVQFGKDCFIYISSNGYSEFGNMASLGSGGKIICTDKIILGNYARLGSESQLIDTTFHQLIDTSNNEKYPMSTPIHLGNYNYIGNRVSIMSKTVTPNFCTIASNSLSNKDYTGFGENILIGGIPCKLIRENISRDWKAEQEIMENLLILKK